MEKFNTDVRATRQLITDIADEIRTYQKRKKLDPKEIKRSQEGQTKLSSNRDVLNASSRLGYFNNLMERVNYLNESFQQENYVKNIADFSTTQKSKDQMDLLKNLKSRNSTIREVREERVVKSRNGMSKTVFKTKYVVDPTVQIVEPKEKNKTEEYKNLFEIKN